MMQLAELIPVERGRKDDPGLAKIFMQFLDSLLKSESVPAAAVAEVLRRIEATGHFETHRELSRFDAECFSAGSPVPLDPIEFQIHIFIWRPWIALFRNGTYRAAARVGSRVAPEQSLPLEIFDSNDLRFNFAKRVIEETVPGGARFVDVVVKRSGGAAASQIAPVEQSAEKTCRGRPLIYHFEEFRSAVEDRLERKFPSWADRSSRAPRGLKAELASLVASWWWQINEPAKDRAGDTYPRTVQNQAYRWLAKNFFKAK
jgi:hypothetical protein